MSTKRALILFVIVAVLATISIVVAAQKTNTAEPDIILTKKQYLQFQRLQKALPMTATSQGKNCHIEYRNCWTDYEYRCHPSGAPGGGVTCEQVPVRRCGPPVTVCD